MSFTTYLFFTGNCRAAMERYHEIFGGELVVLTGADTPQAADSDEGATMPDDLVMHAMLKVGDTMLLASDDPTAEGTPVKAGFRVSHSADDAAEARRVFDALAKGGSVQLPLGETFFSSAFGMCTDEFDIPWMVGIADQG